MAAKPHPTDSNRYVVLASLLVTAGALGLAAWMLVPAVSLPDVSAHMYWYLGRSAGLIAYWLLFLSVVLGIAVSSRVFDGLFARGWVYDIHKFLSIFVLLAMVFHVLILLPDPWAKFTLVEMLVPFESHYRPTPVALGTVTLYGSIAVTASFYLKRFIGQKGWRWLHYTTFGLFVMALIHGLLSGTDSERPAVQISYLVSGVLVLFFVFFRILVTRAAGGKPRPAKTQPLPQITKAETKPLGEFEGADVTAFQLGATASPTALSSSE
jgi:predicted ferric reductase